MAYPSSIDNGTTLPYPSATDDTNSPSLSSGQSVQNNAIIAIETLIGSNATQTTPTAEYNVLQATSATASEWGLLTLNNVASSTGTGDFVFATSPTISSPTISSPTISSPTITGSLGNISTGTITASGAATLSSTLAVTGATTLTGLLTANGGISIPSGNTMTVGSNPVWQYLGSSTTTTDTSFTSLAQITGLSVSVTVPAGYTKVRISCILPQQYNSGAYVTTFSVWRGSVGTGTQVGADFNTQATGEASGNTFVFFALDTPTAGSVTYNIGGVASSGTGHSNGSSAAATLLVEVC